MCITHIQFSCGHDAIWKPVDCEDPGCNKLKYKDQARNCWVCKVDDEDREAEVAEQKRNAK